MRAEAVEERRQPPELERAAHLDPADPAALAVGRRVKLADRTDDDVRPGSAKARIRRWRETREVGR